MDCYCNISDKTMNHKSRNKHDRTKRHYFMEKYVTNIYNCNDVVWDDVEKSFMRILLVIITKFNEFKIFVTCKINDDVEIKVIKGHLVLRAILPTFLDMCKHYDVGTVYVHVDGKMLCNNIRENLSSKYDINCTPDMKIRNVTKKFVSRFGNMT